MADTAIGAALGDLLLVGDAQRARVGLGQGLHRPDAQGQPCPEDEQAERGAPAGKGTQRQAAEERRAEGGQGGGDGDAAGAAGILGAGVEIGRLARPADQRLDGEEAAEAGAAGTEPAQAAPGADGSHAVMHEVVAPCSSPAGVFWGLPHPDSEEGPIETSLHLANTGVVRSMTGSRTC